MQVQSFVPLRSLLAHSCTKIKYRAIYLDTGYWHDNFTHTCRWQVEVKPVSQFMQFYTYFYIHSNSLTNMFVNYYSADEAVSYKYRNNFIANAHCIILHQSKYIGYQNLTHYIYRSNYFKLIEQIQHFEAQKIQQEIVLSSYAVLCNFSSLNKISSLTFFYRISNIFILLVVTTLCARN